MEHPCSRFEKVRYSVSWRLGPDKRWSVKSLQRIVTKWRCEGIVLRIAGADVSFLIDHYSNSGEALSPLERVISAQGLGLAGFL
jgi:hypothetical protein